jgi:hypothetical protein
MRGRLASIAQLWALLLGCALIGLSCDQRPTYDGNPPSLWVNYSTREIDLVLVDYEPPPF